ncbi:hypothetical protein VTN31DRAFT_1533 [Thermomyces dupontii]|uniref:uncharacterized protein n=1 Tax=Talaromyces thermophilus TaxID=28565 RepID=UPI003743364C
MGGLVWLNRTISLQTLCRSTSYPNTGIKLNNTVANLCTVNKHQRQQKHKTQCTPLRHPKQPTGSCPHVNTQGAWKLP